MTNERKNDWAIISVALLIGFLVGANIALQLCKADLQRTHQIVLDQGEELEDIFDDMAK